MASADLNNDMNMMKVGNYTISTRYQDILGRGAYGVVHKATDAEKKMVAAKVYDRKRNPKINADELKKLMKLKNENIVEIFDFLQENDTFWMFMEFCSNGDLNKFFYKQKLSMHQRLQVMLGVAKGIVYLHSNNIIHRDIKPENILMGENLNPKLTDFDLSKFLEPEQETMTTNVGTLAFKAPEFFGRRKGTLRYHRHVDIFACALTFLALIQENEESTSLVPRIETPLDDSEYYSPSIGQLIAERIKYKIPELNVVVPVEKTDISGEDQLKNEIRKLIQRMTCVNPEDQIYAFQVLRSLEQVNNISRFSCESRIFR